MTIEHHCVTNLGEHFVLLQNEKGKFLCPVCGSPEFSEPPYYEDGSASFEMCTCGFEFGFDDSNMASADAIEGIVANWDRWRLKIVEKNKHSKERLNLLTVNLESIGFRLAFDLVPVKFKDDS